VNILGKFLLNVLGVLLILGSLAVSTPVQATVQTSGMAQPSPRVNLVPRFPNLVVDDPDGVVWTQYQGDGDAVVEPGEIFNITVRLRNVGSTLATKISSTLSLTSGDATILAGSSLYPNIPVGGTAVNITSFRVKVKNSQPCDSFLGLRFVVRYSKGNRSTTYNFSQAVGPASSECTVFNTAPTAADDAYATSISTALSVPAPGVLANDLDPDLDRLTAALVSAPSQGTLALNPDGSFTYTPPVGFSGDVSFTYRASDGLLSSNLATVTITMTGNNPPLLTMIPVQRVNELSLLTFTANATDPEAPPEVLTFTLDSASPAGAAIDPVSGEFTWTPDEIQGPGVYTTTVIVTDSGVPARSDSQAVQITVDEVNAAPVMDQIPSFSIGVQETLIYTVTVTDSDYPPESFTFSLDPGAPVGASIDADTGVFTWTPSPDQGGGVYTITARVVDDGIPPLEASSTFQVTVSQKLFLPVMFR
jgi:Bacterial Ig domain/Putative Ig domain